MTTPDASGLYIVLISVHGLIRSSSLELGRDADTGGQTKYVVDLAKALAAQPGVKQVDLFTRLINDSNISKQYAQEIEPISDKARIVRVECGPDEYFPKEQLWDHLGVFTDNMLNFFREQNLHPDLLHSHYADAGFVALQLSHSTGIPFIHTGHSLGRDKRKRLMASGMSAKQVRERYQINRRIEAEEAVLASANLVITSTFQEITDQYELYDYYHPETMAVIPPGTDLSEFHPPVLGEVQCDVAESIRRFLDDPHKPMILALSRPDPRKNIATLVEAYGKSKELQSAANLVIIAGNRDDIRKMDDGAQSVLSELLVLIDYYDLYGKVAIPKHHRASEVPAIYRMAASSRGIFVNPALTEPFGLTLLESAACGLPFVATENGGPVDIVKNCRCGLLVDPLNSDEMGDAIKSLVFAEDQWRELSSNGIENVTQKYSWDNHAESYLERISTILAEQKPIDRSPAIVKASRYVDRILISDLDKTLLSDTQGLSELMALLQHQRKTCAFGIATSRRFDDALKLLKAHNIPKPDILISGLGTEIHYSTEMNLSTDWAEHIDHDWNPKAIHKILASFDGVSLHDDSRQGKFNIVCKVDSKKDAHTLKDNITSYLRQADQSVNVFLEANKTLFIVPARASKGLALRYVSHVWDIPTQQILVAAGSGADEDMMHGGCLSVVVSNRQHETINVNHEEMNLYYSDKANAAGILQAIDHYKFFEI